MIRGGIAAKYGDDFEALWTAQQLLDVLLARATSMRIEPFNEGAKGFEFWIERGQLKQWTQCKRRAAGGARWTIQALEREGILGDFGGKLADQNTECVFVSSDPAPEFKSVCEKARLTEDPIAFGASLSEDDVRTIRSLELAWKLGLDAQHPLLRRCRVETVSAHSIYASLEQLCSVLFQTEPQASVAALRAYIFEHLTHTLTPERVRNELEAKGLKWRYSGIDPTAEQAIVEATDSYLRSYSQQGIGGEVLARAETAQAVAALADSTKKTIVIAGTAGGGKSAVMAALIEALRASGTPVLALRIDRYLACASVKELGQALVGRSESPISILAGRYPQSAAVLLIDQVDAVSEASGRSALARDWLFQLAAQAEFFTNIKVVLACRSYDLENDSRLEQLKKDVRSEVVVTKALDWEREVEPLLRGMRADPARFSPRERLVLCSPLNLSLFADLLLGGEEIQGEISRGRLIELLMQVRDRDLRQLNLPWTVAGAMGRLATFMSDHQALAAPESVLSDLPGCVDQLSSMALIQRDRGQIQLAHESFFDHLFASGFLARSETVRQLLGNAPQKLFRRTQVRQIFALLRERGVNQRYLSNLVEVMSSPDVRYLVKDAVGSWLASVHQPTADELQIVLGWFGEGNPLDAIARTILSSPEWINLISEQNLLEGWLNGTPWVSQFAKWMLSTNAVKEPLLVASILRRWWGGREDRALEVIGWFQFVRAEAQNPELEALCADAIAACPATAFEERHLPGRSDISHWAHKNPNASARMLAAWYRRWFEVFTEGHPFKRDRNQGDTDYWTVETAQKAPVAFLVNLLPLFTIAIRRDEEVFAKGKTYHREFDHREPDDGEHPFHIHIMLFRRALRTVAQSDVELARKLLGTLPLDLGSAPMHLMLEAIAANGERLADMLVALLDHPQLLKAGYDGAEWISFARAAAAAFPFLSEKDRLHAEQVIRMHRPEYASAKRWIERAEGEAERRQDRKYAMYALQRSGMEEWAILTTIGHDQLSVGAQRRLAELQRKFRGHSLPEAHGPKGGFVHSPIKTDATAKMNDAAWLTAMERYGKSDRDREWGKDFLKGGSRELSRALQQQVKVDSKRFVNLLGTMPRSLNADYVEGVLDGLRETDAATADVVTAIKSALEWKSPSIDRNLCFLVQRYPEAGGDAIVFGEILRIAEVGPASEDGTIEEHAVDQEALTISRLLDSGGLHLKGINGERGAAYEALAAILWVVPETYNAIVALVDRRADTEPLASVRTCVMYVVNAIGKYDESLALDLLLRMARVELRSFATQPGLHILRWAYRNYPERMRPIVDALLAGQSEALRATGLFLLSGRSLDDAETETEFKALWPTEVLSRRIAAFRAAGNLLPGAIGERSDAWIRQLMNDEEKAVRREAGRCSWKEVLDAKSERVSVAEEFVGSKAFEDSSDQFMMAIEDRIDRFPKIGLAAIKRVVHLAKAMEPGGSGHHLSLHNLGSCLVTLYRALENDANGEAQVLDLFDAYIALDTHGVRAAVAEYERA